MRLSIKPRKDIDDMLDVINAELINVCWEYLEGKELWLDKYQLATLCAQLITLAMENCEEPFRIVIKTNRALIQEYLDKNKKKRETLERIKKENKDLDKKIAKELERREKPKDEVPQEEVHQETPAQVVERKIPTKDTSKKKFTWDAYSVSTKFTF